MKHNSNKLITINIPRSSFVSSLKDYISDNIAFNYVSVPKSKLKTMADSILDSEEFWSECAEYFCSELESGMFFENIDLCRSLDLFLSDCKDYNDLLDKENKKMLEFRSIEADNSIKAAKNLLESNGYSVKLHGIP